MIRKRVKIRQYGTFVTTLMYSTHIFAQSRKAYDATNLNEELRKANILEISRRAYLSHRKDIL
jgi:hypothetical protein